MLVLKRNRVYIGIFIIGFLLGGQHFEYTLKHIKYIESFLDIDIQISILDIYTRFFGLNFKLDTELYSKFNDFSMIDIMQIFLIFMIPICIMYLYNILIIKKQLYFFIIRCETNTKFINNYLKKTFLITVIYFFSIHVSIIINSIRKDILNLSSSILETSISVNKLYIDIVLFMIAKVMIVTLIVNFFFILSYIKSESISAGLLFIILIIGIWIQIGLKINIIFLKPKYILILGALIILLRKYNIRKLKYIDI